MDLEAEPGERVRCRPMQTFEELYRYCYLVASVVGLVCIRIFGYSDARAEKLAEETGIAFQLTNILRDVKEDVERGRVYLPLDLLGEFGVSVERVKELAAGAAMTERERAMLASLGAKAEGYYGSAEKLLPLIDQDSRAALWVLVTIYHGLLKRIVAADGDVFSRAGERADGGEAGDAGAGDGDGGVEPGVGVERRDRSGRRVRPGWRRRWRLPATARR